MAEESDKDDKTRKKLLDLLDSYTPQQGSAEEIDTLHSRFKILVKQPLPDFSHRIANAYAASDSMNPDKEVYAAVLNKQIPYRMQDVEKLLSSNQQNLQSVVGAGNIYLSSDNEKHQVLFFEKPEGRTLRSVLDQANRMHEHRMIDNVLLPLSKALGYLQEKEVVHGGLNPETIYIGSNIVAKEPLSMPYGYYQHYLYEPLERAMAKPLASGIGDGRCDVYALAVTTFEACFGLDHIRRLGRDAFIAEALNVGVYHLFSHNVDMSDNVADFFRGAMSENIDERWGVEQFQQWLGGKRYNMIVPPAPKDSARALEFLNVEYFSRRALANALHRNWRTTLKEIWDLRIDRWLEMGAHQPELASQAERVLRIGGSGSTDRNNREMMSRIIALLDPAGPIRTQNLSFRPEGIGITLLKLMQDDDSNGLQELITVINSDLPNYWTYLTESEKPAALSQMIWKIQRVRGYAKFNSLGFGVERILYEFNPGLSCQSKLVKSYNVQSIQGMLAALDSIASKLGKQDTSLLDRHISAFLACKLDIGKEIKIQDVAQVPALAQNQELIAIRILARAQQKVSKDRYVGLACWVALRVDGMLSAIHNRGLRGPLKARLRTAAASGNIPDVLNVLVNREIIQKDQEGFHRALLQYTKNELSAKKLQDKAHLSKIARRMGGKVSSLVGYAVLVISFYYIAGKLKGG